MSDQASRGLYSDSGRRAQVEWAPGSVYSASAPPPQVAVFQCIPGDKTGKLRPVTSVSSLNDSGKLITVFELPEEALPFQEFRFHLYVNNQRNWNHVPIPRGGSFAGQNLLTNGSLDQFSDLEPDTPTGWYVQGSRKSGGFTVSSER